MKRFLPPGCVELSVPALAVRPLVFLFGAMLCFCGGLASAATISQWTFETIPPADLTNSANGPAVAADVGGGSATASGVHASAATDWTTPVGNGSANSFSANTWGVGDFWQFQLSTLGFVDLVVAFDQTSSGTGPRDFKLAYSLTGSSFTDFQSYAVLENGVGNPAWSGTTPQPAYAFSFDLSSIAGVENVGNVFLRLVDTSGVSADGGAVGSGGTNRVDNFTVSGTAIAAPPGVPESGATIVVFGLSLIVLISPHAKELAR
jgi:hypothetical protein